MSEQTDAVILVVSEETGAISLAHDAKLYYDLSPLEVQRKLREILDQDSRGGENEQEAAMASGKDVLIER
jgi:diadenylate cyclase